VIRFAWVILAAAVSTFVFGTIAIVASLARARGNVYYWCTQSWARAIIAASGTPVRVHGMERVDWTRPHVLVSNHTSEYDILTLAAALPVPFHFVGKKELNRVPLFGMAWRAAGHISIDRSNRASALTSLKRAGEKIRARSAVVILFPEGTRSGSGELQPFKKGAFIMATEANIPVIPTIIEGSRYILPPGKFRISPRTIHLHIGDPVAPDGSDASDPDRLSERVRARMLELQRLASLERQ
jgi:1-acyl-sn-glycerol-3-phosphate acyltransferase